MNTVSGLVFVLLLLGWSVQVVCGMKRFSGAWQLVFFVRPYLVPQVVFCSVDVQRVVKVQQVLHHRVKRGQCWTRLFRNQGYRAIYTSIVQLLGDVGLL